MGPRTVGCPERKLGFGHRITEEKKLEPDLGNITEIWLSEVKTGIPEEKKLAHPELGGENSKSRFHDIRHGKK